MSEYDQYTVLLFFESSDTWTSSWMLLQNFSLAKQAPIILKNIIFPKNWWLVGDH